MLRARTKHENVHASSRIRSQRSIIIIGPNIVYLHNLTAHTFENASASRLHFRQSCAFLCQMVERYVCLYKAVSSPLGLSNRSTLVASTGRPVHSDANSTSPGSFLAMQQLRAKTKSLTCPLLSARYSFIQLSEQRRQCRERKFIIFESVPKREFEPGHT